MIVITGADTQNNKVYSNNPSGYYGYFGEQTYDEFLKGFVIEDYVYEEDFESIYIPNFTYLN